MACVTLKRSHNFDSTPGTSSHPRNHETPSNKRRRCGTSQLTFVPSTISSMPSSTSPFHVNVPGTFTSSPTQLIERVQAEIRRLQRRKIIPKFRHSRRDISTGNGGNTSDSSSDSESPSAHLPCTSATPCERMTEDVNSSMTESSNLITDGVNQTPSSFHMEACIRQMSRSPVQNDRVIPVSKMDLPLFSFRQMNLICARLLREREDELRGEYENILSNKLAEQYEAYLKFNHDQLYRRHHDQPISYVS